MIQCMFVVRIRSPNSRLPRFPSSFGFLSESKYFDCVPRQIICFINVQDPYLVMILSEIEMHDLNTSEMTRDSARILDK